MKNSKTLSHSIVFVDHIFKNGVQPNMPPQQINNPFSQLCNLLFLQSVVGINGLAVNNPVLQSFVFGNIIIQNNLYPPQFSVIHNTSSIENKEIKEIAKTLIIKGNLENVIGAIGVNHTLYIANTDNKINLKNLVCQNHIAEAFNEINVRLVFKLNEFTTLTLNISDASINKEKAIYIQTNFNSQLSSANSFNDILNANFYEQLNEKLDIIFEHNAKSQH